MFVLSIDVFSTSTEILQEAGQQLNPIFTRINRIPKVNRRFMCAAWGVH